MSITIGNIFTKLTIAPISSVSMARLTKIVYNFILSSFPKVKIKTKHHSTLFRFISKLTIITKIHIELLLSIDLVRIFTSISNDHLRIPLLLLFPVSKSLILIWCTLDLKCDNCEWSTLIIDEISSFCLVPSSQFFLSKSDTHNYQEVCRKIM